MPEWIQVKINFFPPHYATYPLLFLFDILFRNLIQKRWDFRVFYSLFVHDTNEMDNWDEGNGNGKIKHTAVIFLPSSLVRTNSLYLFAPRFVWVSFKKFIITVLMEMSRRELCNFSFLQYKKAIYLRRVNNCNLWLKFLLDYYEWKWAFVLLSKSFYSLKARVYTKAFFFAELKKIRLIYVTQNIFGELS